MLPSTARAHRTPKTVKVREIALKEKMSRDAIRPTLDRGCRRDLHAFGVGRIASLLIFLLKAISRVFTLFFTTEHVQSSGWHSRPGYVRT